MENKKEKNLLRWFLIGFSMIIFGIIIWRESSFIISGLGVVVIGIALMIYFNKK
jgi:uncharacterized membrane protein